MKKSQLIQLVNELVKENSIERELDSAFKQGAQVIATGAKNVKPSKHDKPLKEGVISTSLVLGLIAGAPGIMELISKAVNFIGRILNKLGLMNKQNATGFGEWLKRNAHKWEDRYISSIGGWLKLAYPKKFKNQDPHDDTSSLHDYCHGIYLGLLTALGIGAGIEAYKAAELSYSATKGGMAMAKGLDVKKIAGEIVKHGLDF